MHGIRDQQGQDAQEKEPPVAAQEWPDVLQELADGAPRIVGKPGTIGPSFCYATLDFARPSWPLR